MFWIALGPLWLIAIAALACSLMLPGELDLYFHDRYFVVAKSHLVMAILILVIVPLLTLTVRRLR